MSTQKPEERVTGLYRLVTLPWFYQGFQGMIGASRARDRFFSEWVQTNETSTVLDVGCGPGIVLPNLTYGHYVGVDHNAGHIAQARELAYPNTTFYSAAAQDLVPTLDQQFDAALTLGFLHHLNDSSVTQLIDAILPRLRRGGQVFFMEPVFIPQQNPIARALKQRDSGQYIRTVDGYITLLQRPGFDITHKICSGLLRIPYNHFWGCLTAHD